MVLIRYFIEGKEFASRTRENIPRQNESIRFNSVRYDIEQVVWIEDEAREWVAIEITKAI